MTGLSPFRALYGFDAATAVSAALATSTAPTSEPLEHAALLASGALRDKVNQAADRAAEKSRLDFVRKARGKVTFSPGDYVLVFNEAPRNKLDRKWNGPYIVHEQVTPVTYRVSSLLDETLRVIHVNRLHSFDCGDLTADQLHAQARKIDEFDISAVLDHRFDKSHALELRVRWLGYEDYAQDDPRAWSAYDLCSGQPAVQEYVQAHDLVPRPKPEPQLKRRTRRKRRN